MGRIKIKTLSNYMLGYGNRKKILIITFSDIAIGFYFLSGVLLVQLLSDGLVPLEDLTTDEIRQTISWVCTLLPLGLTIRTVVGVME